MNALADLGQWWNLVYVIPFCAGVFLTLLSTLSMFHLGGHGFRAGHGLRAGHAPRLGAGRAAAPTGAHARPSGGVRPAGSASAAGRPGHAPASAKPGAAHPAPAPRAAGRAARASATSKAGRAARDAGEGGLVQQTMAVIGATKMPFSVLFPVLLTSWGFFGWVSNQALAPVLPVPGQFLGPSLGIASFASLLFTRLAAEGLARITPPEGETYAVEAEDLVGTLGEAVFRVTQQTGSVHLYDATGTLHELRARCRPGHPALEKGSAVVVVDYDPRSRRYWVEGWREGADGGPAIPAGALPDAPTPEGSE